MYSADSHFAFPRYFTWGVAASAFQTEGACHEDNKGPSIWDQFTHQSGRIKNGDTASSACDTYHRFRDDSRLLSNLGIQSFRFSMSWPRVQPLGCGPYNQAGLDFYKRLIHSLLEAQVKPMITLYHWDLPQALEAGGGWLSRDVAFRFADYAYEVTRQLCDVVDIWAILNEPWVFTYFGYGVGEHAPGKQSLEAFFKASHIVNLAQGLAIQAVRSQATRASIGSAFNYSPALPKSNSCEDAVAVTAFDAVNNHWFVEPIEKGTYPLSSVPEWVSAEMDVRPGDLTNIHQGFDWIGVNYYFPQLISGRKETDVIDGPITDRQLPFVAEHRKGKEQTDMGWEVWPEGLEVAIRNMWLKYRKQLSVTECGCACNEEPNNDLRINDLKRIDYLRRHLSVLHKAILAGVDVRSFYLWSFLDNFEWTEGYSQRFGIVFVNFDSLHRIPKESAKWYANLIRSGGASIHGRCEAKT